MADPKVALDKAIEAYKRLRSRKPQPVKPKPVKVEEKLAKTG